MAAEIFELFDSRDLTATVSESGSSAMFRYGITGADDEIAAIEILEDTITETYQAAPGGVVMVLQGYELHPKGNGVWECQVRYGTKEPKESGSASFQFDTTGSNQKVTHSLASTYFPDGAAIDFEGAINVSADNNGMRKVDGVEIPFRQFSFTLERTLADPVPPSYLQALYELTDHVNSDTVTIDINDVQYTFNPGELLYKGATGGKRSGEQWQISLKFDASPNQTGLSFGGVSNVAKDGWEYLWVFYEQAEVANTLFPSVRQVCVEQVYETAALAVLVGDV